MKATAILILGTAFAMGAICSAQDMVEYSHAATKPPVGLQGLSNKLSESLQKSAAQTASSGPAVQTVDSAKAAASPQAAAKPTPAAIFILTDGKQLESSHYVLTAQSLVIQDGPKPQTIPLSALNREATTAANRKRGVDLTFPSSTSQMTISF